VFVFNTLTLDKKYSEKDIKRVVPIKDYGLDDGFYGGRVKLIGETDGDILLLLENMDGLKVIDTAAVKLDNINIKFIRDLAKKRKLKFDAKTPKEELIKMLGG